MEQAQEYRTILVGIDGSEQAKQAFEKALEVAKRNRAKVIIAHVIENRLYGVMGYSANNAELLQVETDQSKEIVEEYKQKALAQGVTDIEALLTFGSPKLVLAQELPEKYQVDLIMVGQTGLNVVERWMMGSVSEYIIRHAPCDVLVVRETPTEP